MKKSVIYCALLGVGGLFLSMSQSFNHSAPIQIAKQQIKSKPALASTFDGLNWADARDNFVDGIIVPSGIDSSQSAAQIGPTAEVILSQFQTKLSANTIRLGINYATVTDANYWPKYKAIIDKATDKGMKVVLAYWEGASSKDGKVDNLAEFDAMWDKVIIDYKNNDKVYFEVFNEPHGYAADDWKNFAANWINRQLSKFNVRGRILIGGTGYSENVAAVGPDVRFNGCLFSQHIYPWWSKIRTEAGWQQNLDKRVGGYKSRTIVTEFGAAMKTHANDYFLALPAEGEVDRAFMAGVTNKIRAANMGSVYWPGLRDGDDFSLTNRSGTGINTTLTITNSSGKDLVFRSFNQ